MSEPGAEPLSIDGQILTKGMELLLKGKRGRYRFIDATTTKQGRVVLNVVGPVGANERFHATYLENVKKVVSPGKPR